MILMRGRLVDRELGDILGRHQADEIVFAARDDAEQRLAPARDAIAPIVAVEAEITPATGAWTLTVAAFGKREPRQRLAGRDGLAGIDQHVGDLQSRPFRPHRGLLARQDDAGHLDDIVEAGLCRLQHGDRRPLRRVGFVGESGLRGDAQQRSADQDRPPN